MPEALETWPVNLIEKVLPRHMQIIFEINRRFLDEVRHRYPDDWNRLGRVSLIDEYGDRRVRMAHLAAVGSHKINGVSKIHTDLLTKTTLHDIAEQYPDRFVNLTNGVNPRRWVKLINPDLHQLIYKTIGGDWITNPTQLKNLADHAENTKFQKLFNQVKLNNKRHLADKIKHHLGIEVDPDTLFDIHIKRIHEYKRQLLNLLHVITLYNRLCDSPHAAIVPRTVIFSGKAAPGYHLAKLIIRLINDVASVINNNQVTADKLKLVFIPNYDVTTAGDIIPAAELSQQISMAGTEASGTGNMKLAFNGALTIGTLDGANVEMREHVGHDNMFIFGLLADEARQMSTGLYKPRDYLRDNPSLTRVIDMIEEGYFSPDETDRYHGIVDALTRTDPYLVMADYQSYIDCQAKVEKLYQDKEEWTRRAILNVAGMNYFSSDRTIREYAESVWKVKV
jgi:starch phosphorylase